MAEVRCDRARRSARGPLPQGAEPVIGDLTKPETYRIEVVSDYDASSS